MPTRKLPGRTRIALAMIADQERYSLANNLRELCRLAEQAGRMKCDLLATEEVALTLFCGKASAVSASGPEIGRLAAIARKHRMYLAIGLTERVGPGKRFHNSQVLLDRRGRLVGIHRKMQLTNGELRGGVVPGDRMQVFDTDFGRVAFVICYDTQFIELVRIAGIKGADLILFPHVGGAVGGDLIGRAIAYGNTCWTATVGRYINCVCGPRGHTVASSRAAGKLLVVDADLRRMIMPVNPALDVVSWRTHQWQERRPEAYADLLQPQVVVESAQWPLYSGNELPIGPSTLRFHIVNRSPRRQRGRLTAEFPRPMHLHSDEHVGWFVDRWTGRQGARDWRPRPRRFAFDLAPGKRRAGLLRFDVPAGSEGIEAVRLSGKTAEGEAVFWERQLTRFAPPPELHVPRVKSAAAVARSGAPLQLERQFMGGPARSRSDVRIAHDGRSLILSAVCRRYGPWRDQPRPSPDNLSLVLMPRPQEDLVFWCTLARTGEASTQRREGGHPVQGVKPRWSFRIVRGARQWRTLIRLPFAEFEPAAASSPPAGPSGAGSQPRRWRFNLQRSAPLPDEINRARFMARVVSPTPAPSPQGRGNVAAEWATWNVPYSRIDAKARLGTLIFD